MSNAIFPALPGLQFNSTKTPQWSTFKQRSTGGMEVAGSYYTLPIWKWTLSYEFLRERSPFTEFSQLAGFFNARSGSADSFLYDDPTDDSVTAAPFGAGDGTTTAFQLGRALAGGPFEPIYNLNGSPTVYRNDWQGNQLMYPTSRTNVLLQSEALGTSPWSVALASVAADAATAPSGAHTADKIQETATTGAHYAAQTMPGLADNTSYTVSFFVAAAERSWVMLEFQDKSGAFPFVYFNISGTSVGSHSAGLTPTISYTGIAGWRLITCTFNSLSGASTPRVFLLTATGDGASSYAGTSGNGIYAWGGQVESGPTRTSYIATSTAAVTRTDYSLASGLVTFAVAPLTAAALTWSGNYYWRCRFSDDANDFTYFAYKFWSLGKITFESVKGS